VTTTSPSPAWRAAANPLFGGKPRGLPGGVFIGGVIGHGGLGAGKSVMKLIGIDCGPVRLPLRTLTSEAEDSLRAGLQACGFFAHASHL